MRWWIAAAMVGCGPDPAEDSGSAETGLEGDTDTDTDTDTGNDTEPEATGDTAAEPSPSCPVPWTLPVGDRTDCEVVWVTDYSDDGIVDRREWKTYDSFGRLSLTSDDADDDGYIDEINEYDYDADGNVIEVRRDYDGDGVIDVVTTYTYDVDGWPLETYAEGSGAAFRTTYTNGPCGPERIELDYNDDSVIDLRITVTYDLVLVTSEIDDGADGTIERYYRGDYHPVLGELVHDEVEEDPTRAGPEEVTDYSYDGLGRPDVQTHVWVDGMRTTSFSYDADGRLIEEVYDEVVWLDRTTGTWTCP